LPMTAPRGRGSSKLADALNLDVRATIQMKEAAEAVLRQY
jgi:hypothetical protein